MSEPKRRKMAASADLGKREKLANLKKGDFVQCESGGVFYPAKILEVRESANKEKTYTIHYHNWNSAYDEVISEDEVAERFELFDKVPDKREMKRLSDKGIPRESFGDVVPIDDQESSKSTSSKKAEVFEKLSKSALTTPKEPRKTVTEALMRSSKPTPKAFKEPRKSVPKTPKRAATEKVVFTRPSTARNIQRVSIQSYADVLSAEDRELLELPRSLCQFLIADTKLFKEGKLVKHPPRYTIEQIIEKYKEEVCENGDDLKNIRCSCADTVPDLFNFSIRLMLLRKAEWAHHDEIFGNAKDGKLPHKYYGFVHLIRLFAQLPEVLNVVEADHGTSLKLLKSINHFIKFVENNCDDWFNSFKDLYR